MIKKKCSICKIEKTLDYFYISVKDKFGVQTRCKECTRIENKKWREANPERRKNSYKSWASRNPELIRNYTVKRYGITSADYQIMFDSQNGKCYICGNTEENKRLAVDHCHDSNKIRKLLCSHCNQGLGHFRDNEDLMFKAIEYIKCHRAA